jgi:hypothetical protein
MPRSSRGTGAARHETRDGSPGKTSGPAERPIAARPCSGSPPGLPPGAGSWHPPCLRAKPGRVPGILRAAFRAGPGSGPPPGLPTGPGRVQGLLRAAFRAGPGSGSPPGRLPGQVPGLRRATFRAGPGSGPPPGLPPEPGRVLGLLRAGPGAGPPPCHLPGQAGCRASAVPPSGPGRVPGLLRATFRVGFRASSGPPSRAGPGSVPPPGLSKAADAKVTASGGRTRLPPSVPADAAGPGSGGTVEARPDS